MHIGKSSLACLCSEVSAAKLLCNCAAALSTVKCSVTLQLCSSINRACRLESAADHSLLRLACLAEVDHT